MENRRHLFRKVKAIITFGNEAFDSEQLGELFRVLRPKKLRETIPVSPTPEVILKFIHSRPFSKAFRVKKFVLHVQIEHPLCLRNRRAGKDESILKQRSHRYDHRSSSS
jgi:hypothetical protein